LSRAQDLKTTVSEVYSRGYQAGWAAAIEAAARVIEDERGDVNEIKARSREVRALFAKIDYI
jgi:hypothetical protein